MPSTFTTWRAFDDFANRVRRAERYLRSPETTHFLDTLLATAANRARVIKSGTIAWRAQLGFDVYEEEEHGSLVHMEVPFKPERMKPLRFGQSEGRINPSGLPALYMATTEDTAIAEVRPWVGKLVSVAQMKIVRDQKILDCSTEHSEQFIFYPEEPQDSLIREEAVWRALCRSLSEPITTDAAHVDYIPTQIVAEYLRSTGFDGVVYKSLLGAGSNIALFNTDAADVVNCILQRVRTVRFEHEQASNPYFVRKHYPELGEQEVMVSRVAPK
jgi:hypothetical protein